MTSTRILAALVLSALAAACAESATHGTTSPEPSPESAPMIAPDASEPDAQASADASGDASGETSTGPDAAAPGAGDREIATFGAGCFWCVEAVLEQVDGVLDVESGYAGGSVENPSYREVCTGETGHAEVVRVTFDPSRIGYEELLGWFWRLHDPTTLNRQGADVGTQYRSAIYHHSEAQRLAAERSKEAAAEAFEDPIVTEIAPAGSFYLAEVSHQDYYRLNKRQPYCRAVILPKLDKLGLEK